MDKSGPPTLSPSLPHSDLDVVGAQGANLIFAPSPMPHRPNSCLGVGLGSRGPPPSSRGLLCSTPPCGCGYVFRGVLPRTALRPRTDASGAGGAAEVMFTDQGFPFSLREGLGPLITFLQRVGGGSTPFVPPSLVCGAIGSLPCPLEGWGGQ